MSSTFPVKAIREDFPILKQKVNGNPLAYLDNAATTQKPLSVINAINDYYRTSNANVHRGVHHLSEKATFAYERARKLVSDFINANKPGENIFVRGTTEGINLVAQSYVRPLLTRGDEILITHLEHHSNIVPWQRVCEQTGAKLVVAPINQAGEVELDVFKSLVNEKTKFVAINHISNALGTVNQVEYMTSLAHSVGAKVLIDGAQAAPHMPINVQALRCDFYVFSGHKMYAPTGIGILWGKEALLEEMEPYQCGGEMIRSVTFEKTEYAALPNKFEAGTPNIAGVIGLGQAIEYLSNIGLDAISHYEHELLNYASLKLSQLEEIRFIGTAKNKSAVISFLHKKVHAHDIGTVLNSFGVAVRSGHHCAMPLMDFYQVAATTRASFSFYNTFEEIDNLIAALKKVNEVFC